MIIKNVKIQVEKKFKKIQLIIIINNKVKFKWEAMESFENLRIGDACVYLLQFVAIPGSMF